MKVFVTGANGFIGSHLLKALLARGDHVRALIRPGADRRNIAGLRFEEVIGDVREPKDLATVIEGCEILFHLAGVVKFWMPDKRVFHDTHVGGLENVLRAAQAQKVKRMVHVSSIVTVACSADATPVTESASWNLAWTQDPYVVSKRAGEELLFRFCRATGFDAVVVNPSAVIGPGDIHLTHVGRCIRDYAAGKIPFYVNGGFNGVAVQDVVDGILAAAERGRGGERYLLTGENVSYLQFFAAIDKILGRRTRARPIPYSLALAVAFFVDLASRVGGFPPLTTLGAARLSKFPLYFDAAKAKRALGFAPKSFLPALAQELEWMKTQGMYT